MNSSSSGQQAGMENVQDINSDEIDLFELWNGLMEQKWLIIVVTFASVVMAAAYAFMVTPTYKSTVYFLPPTVEDVQEMNSLNLLVDKKFYQEEEVYSDFLENLASRDVNLSAFKYFDLASLYEDEIEGYQGVEKQARFNKAFEEFSKDISIKYPSVKQTTEEVLVNLQLKVSAERTAEILNSLVSVAKEKTIKQYQKDIQAELHIRQQRIKDQITSLRNVEKDRRLDRIIQLQEAANIAHVLKLSEPMSAGPQVKVQGVANQGLPLYYLGYKLLEAELSALRNRENDDPFIGQLRGLQQNLAELESLKFDMNKFGVVTVDQLAIPAAKPAKPKKALVLAVAGVLGLMLGVFIALIRRAVNNRKAVINV
ncbi:MAG: Wzz/FepE/Etk N-terminal domain-containing protein [Pseudomonadota bacterium]|nr:Wzz/FepE/Etk N-terminal domain-containing protein [Pseudomonadota bacterium]